MSVLLFSKAEELVEYLACFSLYIVAEARPNCEVPEGHLTCILQLRGRIVSFLFFHTSLKDVRIQLTTKTFWPVLGLHLLRQHSSEVVLFSGNNVFFFGCSSFWMDVM